MEFPLITPTLPVPRTELDVGDAFLIIKVCWSVGLEFGPSWDVFQLNTDLVDQLLEVNLGLSPLRDDEAMAVFETHLVGHRQVVVEIIRGPFGR